MIRFSHMLWVLGFWMIGTLALFAFIIPTRLRIGAPLHLLVIAAVAITLAFYFTPLSRFTRLFRAQADLTLPAAVGILNLTISWLVAFRYKNKIVQKQIH